MTPQTPSVGRIVHYVSHGTPVRPDGSQAYTSECRAAIVTAVHDAQEASEPNAWKLTDRSGAPLVSAELVTVDLCVLNPAGLFFKEHVVQHEGDTGHDHAGVEIPAKSYSGGTWHWPERV
ncbi:MAG: hypothetical protein ABIQ18_16505 [Umezawaea sp.]